MHPHRFHTARADRPSSSKDLVTLWTLERSEGQARCALFRHSVGWELRMVIDGFVLLAERCCRQDEVLALAETWRTRLRRSGWRDAAVGIRPKPDRRRTSCDEQPSREPIPR